MQKSQFFWEILKQILESSILNTNYICIMMALLQGEIVVVSLIYSVKPQINRYVKCCTTLSHESVRLDHIPVLLDIEDGIDGCS